MINLQAKTVRLNSDTDTQLWMQLVETPLLFRTRPCVFVVVAVCFFSDTSRLQEIGVGIRSL